MSAPRLVHGPDGRSYALFSEQPRATLFGIENLALVRDSKDILTEALAASGTPAPQGAVLDGHAGRVAAAREALAAPAQPRPDRAGRPLITQLNVANTMQCNMRCSYCYNRSAAKLTGQAESAMSADTARLMVDAFIAGAAAAPHLTFLFIGGEPIVARDVLAQTVSYAGQRCADAGKTLEVGVYTNGLLMDRRLIEWANEYEVSLIVSLDGPPALHDRYRVSVSGAPTCRRVLANIELLMKHSVSPLRRVRTVATSPKHMLPLHQYLYDLGFNEMVTQPAYGGDGLGGRDQIEDRTEFLAWYEGLLLAGVTVAIHPFVPMLMRLEAHGGSVLSWYPCGAGVTMLGVGPSGAVYPCHHFVDEPHHQAGDVRSGMPTLEARRRVCVDVSRREPCRSCWARHMCGGDCYHRVLAMGRGYAETLGESSCDAKRTLIADVLRMFARVKQRRPEALRHLLEHRVARLRSSPTALAAVDLDAY